MEGAIHTTEPKVNDEDHTIVKQVMLISSSLFSQIMFPTVMSHSLQDCCQNIETTFWQSTVVDADMFLDLCQGLKQASIRCAMLRSSIL